MLKRIGFESPLPSLMARWSEVEAEASELAALARGFFDAHKHKTLATLRRDGSPRISGTELEFVRGELWFGSMWRAVKALDLRRDPRLPFTAAPPIRPSGRAMPSSQAGWRRSTIRRSRRP
jgi:hypothetical protein